MGCYRPPSATAEALTSLNQLLAELTYNEIILTGDLNWDWLNSNSDAFKDSCVSLNLTQLIESPTHPNLKCPDKSSLIDLFLTNVPHKYSMSGVFANDISDHCVIAAVRNAKIPKSKPRIFIKRNMRAFVEQALFRDLYDLNWDRIELINDVETAWQFFSEGLSSLLDKHAPFRRYKVKGRDNPWFTPDLADLLHNRNLAWAKARKTQPEADKFIFRQLRNRFTFLIKKAKSSFCLSAITKNLNDPKKFGKVIKSISATDNHSELPPCIVNDATTVTDRATIVDCFNIHFSASGSLFSRSSSTTAMSSAPDVGNMSLGHISAGQPSFVFRLFSVEEVCRALCSFDISKSAGPDHLEPYFLKLAADFIAKPLQYLFNLTITTNCIPEIWKVAYVLPLLKGGDPTCLNNYRPISKLSILSKVLEGLVNDQLKDFLHTNNIFSPYQSGFRKQHSTTTASLKLTNDIIDWLDQKKVCKALFVDLSKAFDTVDHSILKQRLLDIGLSEQAVGWFNNYLSNRKQCVCFEGSSSTLLNVSTGVPQGSVLGPILFVIYVNTLGSNVPNAKFHFYADDTVIYCCGTTLAEALGNLQIAFNLVENQLIELRPVLNAAKTKLLIFSNGRKVPVSPPSLLLLQGYEIELVNCYKYLGILIDDRLTFKPHVENLVKKLRVKLGFFFRHKSCFSFFTRKKLIATTFLPVLDYSDLLYMNAPANCLRSLDTVYHGALRFVTGCKALTHRCILYARVEWPSLAARRLIHWHIFIYKAILGLLPHYLCNYIFKSQSNYCLRSNEFYLLIMPKVHSEFGKHCFKFAAPAAWNALQKTLKLKELINLETLKTRVREIGAASYRTCSCFGVNPEL